MAESARDQIDAILKSALELSDRERERFLDETCDHDTELRRAVDRMLACCEADDVLIRPGGGADGPLWDALAREHAAAFLFVPGERLGAYRVVRLLGHGGMATVYLAERADGQFEQTVALKVLDVGRDFEALAARFAQERRILARLEHPNIARLIDGGSTRNGQPYVVMEYVDGLPIDRYCDERRLGVDQRIGLLADVADAVQYAHGQLIVHRDIKPSNILVTEGGGVKLLDFGIAKLLDPGSDAPVTRSALHPMTPEYASPEQVRGEPLTTSSDVYQLGYLLYCLLTGRPPYACDRRNVAAVVQAICSVEPIRPSLAVTMPRVPSVADAPGDVSHARSTTMERLRRRLAGDLDTIILRSLHKQPGRRYPSAFHLRDDLRRHLEGLPVIARKDTLAYRARKFVRRNRAGVAAAALAVVSLAGGLGVALWQAQEKAKEAANAEDIKNFVLSIFEQADPEVAQGESMTVAALLEQGISRVDSELRNQPATQADLYKLLGKVFHRLGVNDRALLLQEKALALRTRLYGPTSPAVADVLADMGDARFSLGDYDAAIRLHRRALELRRALYGPLHADVASSMSALGKSLGNDGEFEEAGRLLRQSLADLEAIHGKAHLAIAKTQEDLANVLRLQGRHDEAETYFREALRQQRFLLGAGHSTTAQTLQSLAALLTMRGEYAEAEPLAQEALGIFERVYGPSHTRVASAVTSIAGAQHQQARFDEAEVNYRRALAIQRERFGAENMRVAHAQLSLASTLQSKGSHAEAEALARGAHAIFVKSFGEEHMWVAVSLQVHGANLYELGRLDEAESTLERARELTQKIWGERHFQTANVLFDYGKVLLARGRLRDAESVFRSTIDLRRAQYGESHLFVADPMAWLGRCLVQAGRPAEAEPLMLESYPMLLAELGPEYPDTRAARRTLNQMYTAMGNSARADAYR